MGNAVTCTGGFALASRGVWDWSLFLLTLFGLSLIVAAGCVSNNYMDRRHDAKMSRTKNRPLVKGIISPLNALVFAAILGLGGALLLAWKVGALATALALLGLVVYLLFYSVLKYKSSSATLIGSVAGAIPPVVGYVALTARLDLGAWLVFGMIALWQMPHFYAIAVYRMKEYASASIPVLPLVKGTRTTQVHMALYILGFLGVTLLLPVFHFVTYPFLISIIMLSAVWLILCLQGFKALNPHLWARRMFLYSLVVVMACCALIPLTVSP